MICKFQIGDKARIAPAPRPRWWPDSIRPGRIVTIKTIISRRLHCYYQTGNNGKGLNGWLFRSDELRRLEEASVAGGRRKGAGRPKTAIQGA